MTLHTGSGSLPHHVYCLVDRAHVRLAGEGFEPCVWFGLRSYPSRAWGCHVLLECGAIVRDLPLHALAHHDDPAPWDVTQAQRWDCYGWQFSLHAYSYLHGLEARARCAGDEVRGDYLFTAIPIGDGYTAEPGQSKEFVFLKLENGRFAAQPTNHVLFDDVSFTEPGPWPENIKRQTDIYAVECA
jgi:hypothetical protein